MSLIPHFHHYTGSSTSSIVQQNPAAMTASSSVGLVQTNPPSHPPPSYNVAQQFRSKQKQATQSNYALSGTVLIISMIENDILNIYT